MSEDKALNGLTQQGDVGEPRIFRRKFARAMAPQQAPAPTVSSHQPVSQHPAAPLPPVTDQSAPQQEASTACDLPDAAPSIGNLPAPLGPLWDRLPSLDGLGKTPSSGRTPFLRNLRRTAADKAFDVLRSRLLHTLRDKGWRKVAIVAPTSGCGTTFMSVNLAQSLARVPGNRVVLMDLNAQNPGVGKALGVSHTADLSGFLSETCAAEEYLQKLGNTLAVGLVGTSDTPVAELLHAATAEMALENTVDLLDPDVVLFDLPAATESATFMAMLPHVDGVLVVSDGTQTTAAQIAQIEHQMQGQAAFLGVVLNKGRVSDVQV